MSRSTPAVKETIERKRPYDASRRQEQARRTRDRIVDAAERRFLRDGYAATTIAAIAADADVSADTIYKTFGGKPGLVRASGSARSSAPARSRPSSDPTRCTRASRAAARSSKRGGR